ncbi:hypothetical protein [Flavobacterium anhuiense]|mgnify:FL=1|uniref:hypothetical protein n=1 Tax=Flavobacterium anhuiense TaxID=459526 RepID=UPI003D952FB3
MKRISLLVLLFVSSLNFGQNLNSSELDKSNSVLFSYSLLAKDSLRCDYIDLNNAKQIYSKVIDSSSHGVITEQKIMLDDAESIFYYKLNFANSDAQIKKRDAIEIQGHKFNIDSLYYGRKFNRKMPYIFSSLVNVIKFNFNKQKYIAFYIQDVSNPVTLPNTLILLFDISDLKDIFCYSLDFQASEDLKCFNDFDNDGFLDFADWKQGYDYQKKLFRYKLINRKFVLQKKDFVIIEENSSGYYINSKLSNWSYGNIK